MKQLALILAFVPVVAFAARPGGEVIEPGRTTDKAVWLKCGERKVYTNVVDKDGNYPKGCVVVRTHEPKLEIKK